MTATLQELEHAQPRLMDARVDRAIPKPIRRFRPDIEGLRAIAVLSVVFSHLGLGFPGGYIGVDVFFVISGFLITRQLVTELDHRDTISFKAFYIRRIRRILPAATMVIVGTLLALWKWDSPLRLKSDALDGLFSAFSGLNWRLASHGINYFNATTPPSAFQHYWSLAVEEQFYVVWPGLILLSAYLGRRWGRTKVLVYVLLSIMAISLMLSITTTRNHPSWAYFGTQTRAWELAFGALLAVTVRYWTRMPPALASQMSWVGLGLIVLSCFTLGSGTIYPGGAAIWPVLGAGFVIAGGCPGWSRTGELLLGTKPFQFVGRVSYSWYLTHWPFLQILPLALGHDLTTGDKWVVFFGSFGLAVAMFYLIEHPIRTKTFFVRRPTFGFSLGAVLVGASIVTAVAMFNNVVIPGSGVPAHFSGPADTVAAVDHELALAVKVTTIPNGLDPTLAQAPSDTPASTSTCLTTDTSTTLLPLSACAFGDRTAKRTIAVIGDSHANQWTSALDYFGKAHHVRVILFAKAACPPGEYLTYVDPLTGRLYVNCNTWRTAVLAEMTKLRPEYVIVTSELRTVDVDPSGMVQTIRALESDNARVIYLEDTPNPERVGLMPDCLAAHANDVQACSLAVNANSTRLTGFIQRRVEVSAAQAAGATIMNPIPWFCTTTTCPPIVDNIQVYQDDSHVTNTYVKWLSPIFSKTLESIVH